MKSIISLSPRQLRQRRKDAFIVYQILTHVMYQILDSCFKIGEAEICVQLDDNIRQLKFTERPTIFNFLPSLAGTYQSCREIAFSASKYHSF